MIIIQSPSALKENINKLESRYPNGFETIKSEVRQKGDI